MAANPVVVTCTKDTWVKVATAIETGSVHMLSKAPAKYLQTIRATGEAAPADDSDAAVLFGKETYATFSSDGAIDVYVKAIAAAGSVRVDL